jgi:hypothetical protein
MTLLGKSKSNAERARKSGNHARKMWLLVGHFVDLLLHHVPAAVN